MKWILDPETGQRVGAWQTYKRTGDSGPVLYGSAEFVPGDSFKERCLALIAANESPMAHPANPSLPHVVKMPGKSGLSTFIPALNCCQAYEPWCSVGLCQAITKNPNAARLMAAVFDANPFAKGFVSSQGYDVARDLFVTEDYPPERQASAFFEDVDEDGEEEEVVPLLASHVRTEKFCWALWKALSFPESRAPQVEFFWGLIAEGITVVQKHKPEWIDSAEKDERLYALLASVVINSGTAIPTKTRKGSLLWPILRKSTARTAKAFTDARIAVYGGGGWGTERARREMANPIVNDGEAVILP